MNNRDTFEQAAKNETERSPEMIQKAPAVRYPSGVCRAKAQEDLQTDGEISVKLLDSASNVIGDAFDIYAYPDKSILGTTDFLPTVETNDILLVCKANDGNWYLVWPTLIKYETITVQTTYQVDGANNKLQKKTRANVKVLATDSESAWVDVHTGTVCP